jgi:hypothetical protein
MFEGHMAYVLHDSDGRIGARTPYDKGKESGKDKCHRCWGDEVCAWCSSADVLSSNGIVSTVRRTGW